MFISNHISVRLFDENNNLKPFRSHKRAASSTSAFDLQRSPSPTASPSSGSGRFRMRLRPASIRTPKKDARSEVKSYRYTELREQDAPRSDASLSSSTPKDDIRHRRAVSQGPGLLCTPTSQRTGWAAPAIVTSSPSTDGGSPSASPSPRPVHSKRDSISDFRRRISRILPGGPFSPTKAFHRHSAPPEATIPLEGAPRLKRSRSCPSLDAPQTTNSSVNPLKAHYFLPTIKDDSSTAEPSAPCSPCPSCYSNSSGSTLLSRPSTIFSSAAAMSSRSTVNTITPFSTPIIPQKRSSVISFTSNLGPATSRDKRRARCGLPVSSRKHFSAAHPLYRVECFSASDLTNRVQCTWG